MPDILTKEQVQKIRRNSATSFSEDYISSLLDTIDFLYTQLDGYAELRKQHLITEQAYERKIEALERVKDAVEGYQDSKWNGGYKKIMKFKMLGALATYYAREAEGFK